ncbi:MAG: hypothetical protein HGA37_17355 [Lentimicrobium sp.]|nr:hypothetical protein [Lentimicrobium sp.]
MRKEFSEKYSLKPAKCDGLTDRKMKTEALQLQGPRLIDGLTDVLLFND